MLNTCSSLSLKVLQSSITLVALCWAHSSLLKLLLYWEPVFYMQLNQCNSLAAQSPGCSASCSCRMCCWPSLLAYVLLVPTRTSRSFSAELLPSQLVSRLYCCKLLQLQEQDFAFILETPKAFAGPFFPSACIGLPKWQLSCRIAASVQLPSYLGDSSLIAISSHSPFQKLLMTNTSVVLPAHFLQQLSDCSELLLRLSQIPTYASLQESFSSSIPLLQLLHGPQEPSLLLPSQPRQEYGCHHDKLIFPWKVISSTS